MAKVEEVKKAYLEKLMKAKSVEDVKAAVDWLWQFDDEILSGVTFSFINGEEMEVIEAEQVNAELFVIEAMLDELNKLAKLELDYLEGKMSYEEGLERWDEIIKRREERGF